MVYKEIVERVRRVLVDVNTTTITSAHVSSCTVGNSKATFDWRIAPSNLCSDQSEATRVQPPE